MTYQDELPQYSPQYDPQYRPAPMPRHAADPPSSPSGYYDQHGIYHFGPPPGMGAPLPPVSHTIRNTAIGVLIALIVAGGGLAGWHFIQKATASTISVKGVFDLVDSPSGYDGTTSIAASGGHCHGIGGFSDIDEGAQVVVSDDSGKTLVSTSLSAGVGIPTLCMFTWKATIPGESSFYGITIGSRGTVKYSKDEMIKGPSTELGDSSGD